jgi:hypothetical protein
MEVRGMTAIAGVVARIALMFLMIGLVTGLVAAAQRAAINRTELEEAGCKERSDGEEAPA